MCLQALHVMDPDKSKHNPAPGAPVKATGGAGAMLSTGPALVDQILAVLQAHTRQLEAIRADTKANRADTAALSRELQDLKQANPEAVSAVGGVKRPRPGSVADSQVRRRIVHSAT